MTRSLRLTMAYDGTAYAGWQLQPDRPTLQGLLEHSLYRVTGESVRAVASGRTDAGVHALGQVVSCETSSQLNTLSLRRALNAHLPDDVRVLSVHDAPPGFHANRECLRKRYRYVIQDGTVPDVFARRYSWFVRFPLDHGAMDRSAQSLVGTHDFSSFEAAGSPRASSVRTVTQLRVARRSCLERAEYVFIEIEANGFLYNMVRNIVGTLVEVGRGARTESWPAEVLAMRDRRRAGPTAPACGLFLVSAEYRESDALVPSPI